MFHWLRLRASGKSSLSYLPSVAPTLISGRYRSRAVRIVAAALFSSARAASTSGPRARISAIACSSLIGSCGGRIVSSGAASAGPMRPMRRPSRNRDAVREESMLRMASRARLASSSRRSESEDTDSPAITRTLAIESCSSARRSRSAATRESS